MVRREFWSLHLPRKTYREGTNYYGTYPEGFIKKIESLGVVERPVVELCSGMSEYGDVRVDINPESKATLIRDARQTQLENDYAATTIIDPYYSEEDFHKANQNHVSVYEFIKEAMRITRRGGHIMVLHTKPPRKPKQCSLIAIIAISMGPDRYLRMLQVWKKLGNHIKS